MSAVPERAIAPDAPPSPWAELWRDFGRNRGALIGLGIVVALVLAALFADVIAPHPPNEQYRDATLKAPSLQPIGGHVFVLGTDPVGRDVLSRLILGSRNSLIFGLISPTLAAIFGTALGVAAGYFGGIVDRLVVRIIDLLLAFPELLLAIMIAAVLGGGFWNIVAVITIAFVPGFARVARASTLAVKQEPYVEAAVAAGVTTPMIILRHVVPNIAAPVVVLMTLWVASAIRLEASLSFLGIGTQPPNPSWGNIIRDGLGNIFGSPWPIIGAGLAITAVVLAFNLIGDAARDVLDPETAE